MKQNYLITVLLLVLVSCNKSKPIDGSPAGNPSCRIVTVIDNLRSDTFKITYNSAGKISRLSGKKRQTTFEYGNGLTTVTGFAYGTFDYKTIVTSNAAGLPVNVGYQFNTSGTDWENESYEYKGEEVTSRLYTTSSSSTRQTTTYTWQNHNMISRNSSGVTTEYAYHSDKLKLQGDYIWMNAVFNGYEPFISKNLVKSIGEAEILYEFDTKGRIVTVTFSIANVAPFLVYKYEYECN
ncbi:hypothetical protein [Lacibacter sp.]|uniref:hypothetical protein n=1 Tax=Lacibacter sp. TaxID=1915409 RepID=UPI002B4AD97F|nr:hypothetical protein [Lacibacter sp.]HLP39462.1 hypothetical protein [Lacibacter sp.]